MTALQWRRKTIEPGPRLPEARALAARCKSLGGCFIINDDWRVAAAIDADGVHIGRDDGLVSDARIALGPDKILGCSCYNDPELASQALRAGADYIAFGSMYPSTVKPEAVHATLENIQAGRGLVEQPHTGPRAAIVAIGGITIDNAQPVIAAGADSIAMISGLFDAQDIRATASACRELFDNAE